MKKEEFLDLASKLFDQANPQVEENKITLDKNLFDEIVDQVSSEVFEEGIDLIDDYDLEIYSREVTLESIRLNLGYIENAVKNVLERYFETK